MFSRSNKGNNKCPDEIFKALPPKYRAMLAGEICPICKKYMSMNLYEQIDDPDCIFSLCKRVSGYLRSITHGPHHPTNNNWTRICKQNLGIQNEIARIIDTYIDTFGIGEAILDIDETFEDLVEESMTKQNQH